jgi:hypothetical protein
MSNKLKQAQAEAKAAEAAAAAAAVKAAEAAWVAAEAAAAAAAVKAAEAKAAAAAVKAAEAAKAAKGEFEEDKEAEEQEEYELISIIAGTYADGQAFLDRWAGGGWKNISVHRTYEDALQARAEIRSMIREWRENEREACAKVVENYAGAWDDQGYALSQAIRARGQE